jgi:hypothetical protein
MKELETDFVIVDGVVVPESAMRREGWGRCDGLGGWIKGTIDIATHTGWGVPGQPCPRPQNSTRPARPHLGGRGGAFFLRVSEFTAGQAPVPVRFFPGEPPQEWAARRLGMQELETDFVIVDGVVVPESVLS